MINRKYVLKNKQIFQQYIFSEGLDKKDKRFEFYVVESRRKESRNTFLGNKIL